MSDAAAKNQSLEDFWMPFTANRAFKADPRILTRAEGVWYWNDRGEKLIDGLAGLFTTPAGHGRTEIRDAVAAQFDRLDFAPPFQFGTPGAFQLSTEIAKLTPEGMNRIFYANSGSEAVESAIKVALQYHRRKGQGQRQRIVGREKGYHGVNFAGWSVGGMVRNREMFGMGMPGVSHMRHTQTDYTSQTMGQAETGGRDLADDLQRAVDLYGADTIAACIVEPISGSVGILVPPKGYLERLREICDEHGILLIFDEVITGFGRTGEAFAAQTFGVTPDMMTMAKAITNGAVPMAAIAAKDEVYDAIVENSPAGIEFFHGYTWSANPIACAAALATLKIYADEDLFARARTLSAGFLDRVADMARFPVVQGLRGFGMLGAIDLAPGEAMGQRGFAALQALFNAGAVVRVTNDTIILAPSFVMEDDEMDQLFGKLGEVVGAL